MDAHHESKNLYQTVQNTEQLMPHVKLKNSHDIRGAENSIFSLLKTFRSNINNNLNTNADIMSVEDTKHFIEPVKEVSVDNNHTENTNERSYQNNECGKFTLFTL